MLLPVISVLDKESKVPVSGKRGMRQRKDTLERSRGTTTNAAIHADELDSVSRLTLVHQVVIQNDVRAARQLARRCPLRHFLDADALVVAESAEAVLDLQGVSLIVRLRRDGGGGGEVGGGGRGVAVLARVEEAGVGAVVDGLEHFGADEGAARDYALERDHMPEVGGSEGPGADVVIAKGAVEADAISLALDVVLVDIMYSLYDIKKSVVKSGKKIDGFLEETVRKVATIVA
jgi:hypothetical protein